MFTWLRGSNDTTSTTAPESADTNLLKDLFSRSPEAQYWQDRRTTSDNTEDEHTAWWQRNMHDRR